MPKGSKGKGKKSKQLSLRPLGERIEEGRLASEGNFKSAQRRARAPAPREASDDDVGGEEIDTDLSSAPLRVRTARVARSLSAPEDVEAPEDAARDTLPMDDGSSSEAMSDREDDYVEVDTTEGLDQADLHVLDMWATPEPATRTLYDIIAEKLAEREQELLAELDARAPPVGQRRRRMDPELAKLYVDVGVVLASYRSGKLPKAFKVVPRLENWDDVLLLMRPDKWTHASMRAATRLFVSNLKPDGARRFCVEVLLPRVRDNIRQYRKLNWHLYMALRKSTFKPAAYFQGIMLPLCREGATLKEAAIAASVLQKCSVPALHSAVALMALAALPYSGATSLFMKTLLNKKYALPVRVVDALVKYFGGFATHRGAPLPVLWHQSLLIFVQRYKMELKTSQRETLREVARRQEHHIISGEIKRELDHASSMMED